MKGCCYVIRKNFISTYNKSFEVYFDSKNGKNGKNTSPNSSGESPIMVLIAQRIIYWCLEKDPEPYVAPRGGRMVLLYPLILEWLQLPVV